MNTKTCCKVALVIIFICMSASLSACQASQMREYYATESNYVTAFGTVAFFSMNEAEKALYIDFLTTTPTFDDTCFKIVGNNYDLVLERGIGDFLQNGSQIEFITAPRYFGDGYVMPIVSMSADGETILAFDEGYENFLEWLN